MHAYSQNVCRPVRILLTLAVLILAVSFSAHSDDRDLIRSSGDDPYIFVLLDTSGSMQSKPAGGSTIWGADDPHSKAYQAKAAIYDVVAGLDEGTRIGFSTFAQPNAKATTKRWMYKVDRTQAQVEALSWWDDLPFPTPGAAIEFGDGSATVGSCSSGSSITQLYTHRKLGVAGTNDTTLFINQGGAVWEVTFEAPGTSIGPAMDLKVTVSRCGLNTVYEETLPFVPFYTEDLDGTPILTAEFVSSYSSSSPCSSGWRDNDEPGELAHPVYSDPAGRSSVFDRGNVLPLDWVTHDAPGFELKNRDEFLRRMAPNIVQNGQLDPSVIPDFRLGPYVQDTKTGSSYSVRPEYADNPPFGFNNATPLGGILSALEDWYDDWEPWALGTSGDNPDNGFDCRPKFAILLTDGRETCGGNPAQAAGSLLAQGMRTFVIGYGTGVTGNQLQGIADQGGTGKGNTITDQYDQDCASFNYKVKDPVTGLPIVKDICPGPVIAETTDTLKEVLRAIFSSLTKSQTAFAGASVPSGQVDAEDVLLLPSFLPLTDQSTWKGSLVLFERPLPLTDGPNGGKIPDRSKAEWDAADAIMEQAPTIDQIVAGDYKIGDLTTERRVYWSKPQQSAATPLKRSYLMPAQPNLQTAYELWDALGIEHDPVDVADDVTAGLEAEGILAGVLAIRTGTDAEETEHQYLLGDIFHSETTLVGAPTRVQYMSANLYGDGDCWVNGVFDKDNQGYRCFWLRNRWRRQVVFAGSNDGQLHAFHGGVLEERNDAQGRFRPRFGVGNGKELFSYVPQTLMGTLLERGAVPEHLWGVDGKTVTDDAFVVPIWDGVTAINQDDREWRTLLIGSLRRGGRGYFALDITTPDPMTQDPDHFEMLPPPGDSPVPTCHDAPVVPGKKDGCGPLPYAAVRWEFLDLDIDGLPADADGNGADDLGPGWSTPVTGRIKVREGNDEVDKFVAIFGGGIDPENPDVGNFVYFLDLETGRPLYKRQVKNSVPSQVAAVDSDRNGYLDRVYFGDTGGHFYKLSIAEAGDLTTDVDTGITAVTADQWKPLEIFDAAGRESYLPPAIIWSASRREYAIAFGTGDREDLWSPPGAKNDAFFVFMDRGFDELNTLQPFIEADLLKFGRDEQPTLATDLLLQSPPATNLPGYYIEFAESERLISRPFALAGFTVFSTFEPNSLSADGLCINNGSSNLYTLQTTSGNALVAGRERFRTIDGFASSPFAEVSSSGDGDGGGDPGQDTDSEPPEELAAVTELLKSQMPSTCRFTNKSIDIKAIRSDTGLEWLASIEVCVQQKNWKEWRGTH